MSIKTWMPHPLYIAIVELLGKRGPLTDVELHNLLKESYEDISFGNLNQTLMRMEIGGKIHVFTITKGKRRVELLESER